MRYPSDQREKTRRRIVEAAARRFREDGIAATGVATVMADVGMTVGGFYTHFRSKEDLVTQAFTEAMSHVRRYLAERMADARAAGGDPLAAFVDGYLDVAYVDKPGQHCAFAANSQEVARQTDEVRRAAFSSMRETIDLLAMELPPAARVRAPVIMSLMAGSLQLARLAGTNDERGAIIADARRAVMALAGRDDRPSL